MGGWRNSFKNRYDVGFLRVKVIAATDLEAKDLNGKSDPYCMLELQNMRVQTQTIEKTLSPRWDKTFIFPVTDIHAVLSVKVMDQDKTKSDFLGRLVIPLLWMKNNEQSWYALKDDNLHGRARGSILLEFFFVYNHVCLHNDCGTFFSVGYHSFMTSQPFLRPGLQENNT
ncbi:unnamed protein product [Dibothriocephalus latus]|uniref:C2 domain-containing protein n=1 Tax=Dibothriocephalus latus TaxID=60516 RepID=A0A3P7Q210_DIBLA|nr:unnamed protein product [Dibothriocephalus latus]